MSRPLGLSRGCPVGPVVAVASRDWTIWLPLAWGQRCMATATNPATMGVATDVPDVEATCPPLPRGRVQLSVYAG